MAYANPTANGKLELPPARTTWAVVRSAYKQPVPETTLRAIGQPWRSLCNLALATPGPLDALKNVGIALGNDDPDGFIVDSFRDFNPSDPEPEAPTIADDGMPAFTLHYAREAINPPAPREQIVEGITRRGELAAICGDAGSGKTWYCLAKAVCIAAGIPFMGRETIQGPVLVIDEESGHNRLLTRLNALMAGYGCLEDIPLTFITSEGFNLRIRRHTDQMEAIVAELRPIYIVVDALQEVTAGADENSTADMLPPLQLLHRWGQTYDCGIDVIHHVNKAGGYRGASAIKGIVDQLLIISRDEPTEPMMRIASEKNRDGEPVKFMASLVITTYPALTAGIIELGLIRDHRRLSDSQEHVLVLFHDHGPMSIEQVMERAFACSPLSARKAVYALASESWKKLRRANDGGQGSKAIYELVPVVS